MTQRILKIAVLFGGFNEEREISIASASRVTKALREFGHNVIAIDTLFGLLHKEDEDHIFDTIVNKNIPLVRLEEQKFYYDKMLLQLKILKDFDVVFLALHGSIGENGTIQAFLDFLNIPYTGSGHLGSALAIDKALSKQQFVFAHIPTPNWLMAPSLKKDIDRQIGYPLIAKPNSQGSTIGISVVKSTKELDLAMAHVAKYDSEIMLEKFISGRELTVGVLDNQALSVGEIIIDSESIFDYQSKYQAGMSKEVFPARIPSSVAELVKTIALKAHHALHLDGYSRADFRLDRTNTPWLLEVNSLPGMTSTSLYPQSAQASGIEFPELCDRICQLALARFENRSSAL